MRSSFFGGFVIRSAQIAPYDPQTGEIGEARPLCAPAEDYFRPQTSRPGLHHLEIPELTIAFKMTSDEYARFRQVFGLPHWCVRPWSTWDVPRYQRCRKTR